MATNQDKAIEATRHLGDAMWRLAEAQSGGSIYGFDEEAAWRDLHDALPVAAAYGVAWKVVGAAFEGAREAAAKRPDFAVAARRVAEYARDYLDDGEE